MLLYLLLLFLLGIVFLVLSLFFRAIKTLRMIALCIGILLTSLPFLCCAYFLWIIWTV